MMKPLIIALALAVAAMPAFAECQQQLLAAGSKLSEYSGNKSQFLTRYEQAKRLCRAGKDAEAAKMARQLRSELESPTATTTLPSDIPKNEDDNGETTPTKGSSGY